MTVIHDNAAWGVIRFGQERGGFELDTTLDGTDYAAVARAFGCHGERVTDLAEVTPALDRALASGLPAVVDVQTRFVPHPPCRASLRWGGSDARARRRRARERPPRSATTSNRIDRGGPR